MSEIRLYCPDLAEGPKGLSPEESHHAVSSLRVRRGGEVVLFDGAGREGIATVVRADRRRMQVEVTRIRRIPFESAFRLTLAVALPKAPRQAYLIEKCTELGVAAIQPIVAANSVVRPGHGLVDRWTRRAIEACKQSGRAWIPAISSPKSFDEVLDGVAAHGATTLADLRAGATSFLTLLQQREAGASIMVLVGPEGGWTDDEREAASEAGATIVRVAPTVLRIETAAVTVCAAVALASTSCRSEVERSTDT